MRLSCRVSLGPPVRLHHLRFWVCLPLSSWDRWKTAKRERPALGFGLESRYLANFYFSYMPWRAAWRSRDIAWDGQHNCGRQLQCWHTCRTPTIPRSYYLIDYKATARARCRPPWTPRPSGWRAIKSEATKEPKHLSFIIPGGLNRCARAALPTIATTAAATAIPESKAYLVLTVIVSLFADSKNLVNLALHINYILCTRNPLNCALPLPSQRKLTTRSPIAYSPQTKHNGFIRSKSEPQALPVAWRSHTSISYTRSSATESSVSTTATAAAASPASASASATTTAAAAAAAAAAATGKLGWWWWWWWWWWGLAPSLFFCRPAPHPPGFYF